MEKRWSLLDYLKLNTRIVDIKSIKTLFHIIQDWLLLKHWNGQLSKEKTDKWWFRHQKIKITQDQSIKLMSQWSISKIWVMKALSNLVIHLKSFKLSSIPVQHGLGSSLKIVVKREPALPKIRNSYSLNLIPLKWTKKVDKCFNMEEVLSWAIHQRIKAASHLILKVACLNSISWQLLKVKIWKACRDQALLDLLQLQPRALKWKSQWRTVLPALLLNSNRTVTSTKNSINSSVFIFPMMENHLVISHVEAMTLINSLKKAKKSCGLTKLQMKLTGLSTLKMLRWVKSSFHRTTNRSFLIMAWVLLWHLRSLSLKFWKFLLKKESNVKKLLQFGHVLLKVKKQIPYFLWCSQARV